MLWCSKCSVNWPFSIFSPHPVSQYWTNKAQLMLERDLVLLHMLSTDWARERRSFFHRTFVDWLLFEMPHMIESRSHIKTGALFFYNNPQLPLCGARTSPWRQPHTTLIVKILKSKVNLLNVEPTAPTRPMHRLLINVSHDSLPQTVSSNCRHLFVSPYLFSVHKANLNI